MKNNKADFQRGVLAFVAGGVALALVFVMWVYPEVPTASYAMASLLLVLLAVLAWMNQRALKEAIRTRSVRYGANAAVTIGLVVAILTVLSYLNYNHFVRRDLTKNKIHSLSEQTIKVVKDLKDEVKFTIYVKSSERDGMRPVIDNYAYLSKKIKVEWVDPDRDLTKTKAANVKKYGTVIVQSGKRENRVEEATEEKLTNALLKVSKDTAIQACFLAGHGERSMKGADQDGYARVVQDLTSQNYESREVNLLENAKIPETCSVVLVLGPTKSYFPQEVTALHDWLDSGGRAFFALDTNLHGDQALSPEMVGLLADYYILMPHNLVIDPASKVANVSASVPLVGIYSKEHAITKEFAATALFPLTSTVDLKPGIPATLKAHWLARTTQYAFAKTNFVKELASGKITRNPTDSQGPNIVMVAVEGKLKDDKKADKTTRIVAMGSSQVGTNKWVNFGGNSDLILNSVSWLAGDENLISIRPKDENNEKTTLSEVELGYFKFLTKLLLPGSTMLAGIVVWRRRKRL